MESMKAHWWNQRLGLDSATHWLYQFIFVSVCLYILFLLL